MSDQSGRVQLLDAETQAMLRERIQNCGHAECQEVMAELWTYGRRLTPAERLTAPARGFSATDGAA